MIIGSDEILEVGKIYSRINDIEAKEHQVNFLVLREATVDEWKEEITRLDNGEINEFEKHAIDNGATFYEVSVD